MAWDGGYEDGDWGGVVFIGGLCDIHRGRICCYSRHFGCAESQVIGLVDVWPSLVAVARKRVVCYEEDGVVR